MGIGSVLGGLAGGVGGFLLGGPAGAAAGYGLGSQLGQGAQSTIDPSSDPNNQQNAQNLAQYNAKMALAQQQLAAANAAYNAKAPLRQQGLASLAQYGQGQGNHRGIFGANTPLPPTTAGGATPPAIPPAPFSSQQGLGALGQLSGGLRNAGHTGTASAIDLATRIAQKANTVNQNQQTLDQVSQIAAKNPSGPLAQNGMGAIGAGLRLANRSLTGSNTPKPKSILINGMSIPAAAGA